MNVPFAVVIICKTEQNDTVRGRSVLLHLTRDCYRMLPVLGCPSLLHGGLGGSFLGSVLLFMARGKGRVLHVFRAFEIEQINSLHYV